MVEYYTYSKLEYNGRLGNQLWQMASTIGRARRDGVKPLFKPDWEYRKFFRVPDEMFGNLTRNNHVDFSAPKNGYTDYMQRFEEFADCEDYIRSIFQPSDLAIEGVQSRWPDLYGRNKPRIAVHIRRGDYVQHPDLFPATTRKYRSAAVFQALDDLGISFNTLEEAYDQIDILVFSDDIPWCRQNQPEQFTFIEGQPRAVEVRNRRNDPEDQYDMFLMADCDKHVIANSSYSWWGAFLSEKDKSPFYPSIWFGEKIPEYPVWRKMIPNTWREVEC